jgi:transcriptional regulator with XRE-family HTH domain
MPNETNQQRLARLVRERRKQLRLTQVDVQNQGGPSTATLRGIEGGKGGDYRAGTLEPLEKILRWQIGSISEILRGNDPIEISHQDAYLQSQGLTYEEAYANKVAIPPDPLADPAAGGGTMQQLFAQLLRSASSSHSRLSAADLQELADHEWVRERMETFSPEERQMVKDYITELGNSRYYNWEDQFLPPTDEENEEEDEPNITQPRPGTPSAIDRRAGSGAESSKPPIVADPSTMRSAAAKLGNRARTVRSGDDKPSPLTVPDQGSKPDYELAARTGETEYQFRKRTEPQPEDENQDDGSTDPA